MPPVPRVVSRVVVCPEGLCFIVKEAAFIANQKFEKDFFHCLFFGASVILSLALDWFICEKRRNLYLLPSYFLRLLALPIGR